MSIGGSYFDRAALLDTGALVALANPADGNRVEALACANALAADHLPIYVSIPAIIEAHRQILHARGRSAARALLSSVYDGSLNIVDHEPLDEVVATEILDAFPWIDLTFADAVQMAVMRRVGIRVAFSFDADFLRAGFLRIPPFYPWW